MTEQDIYILALGISFFGLAIDLLSDRHESNIVRRVTVVQWVLICVSMGVGSHIAVNVPPLSENLPMAIGFIVGGSTVAGAKIGFKASRYFEHRARVNAIRQARRAIVNG